MQYHTPEKECFKTVKQSTTKLKMQFEWERNYSLTIMSGSITYGDCTEFKSKLNDLLKKEPEVSVYRRFVRHLRHADDNPLISALLSLIHKGQKDILLTHLDCDQELVKIPLEIIVDEDRFEFVQHERVDHDYEEDEHLEEMNLVMATAHGKSRSSSLFRRIGKELEHYHSVLAAAMRKKEPIDLVTILENERTDLSQILLNRRDRRISRTVLLGPYWWSHGLGCDERDRSNENSSLSRPYNAYQNSFGARKSGSNKLCFLYATKTTSSSPRFY